MADFTDYNYAAWAVSNPNTPAAALADIARLQPGLRAAVAGHPAAYPGLLDWLAGLGDPQVTQAVNQARGRAPVGYAPPGAPAYPVAQPGSPQPAHPVGPKPKRGRFIAIAAGVLAIALIAVGIIFVPTLLGGPRTGGGSSGGNPVGGGLFPADGPAWKDGAQTTFSVPLESIYSEEDITLVEAKDYGDFLFLRFGEYGDGGAYGGAWVAVDTTGAVLWQAPGEQLCADALYNGFVACVAQLAGEGDWGWEYWGTLNLYRADGQTELSQRLEYYPTEILPYSGDLVVIGSDTAYRDEEFTSQPHFARFGQDGREVWDTRVSAVCNPSESDPYSQTVQVESAWISTFNSCVTVAFNPDGGEISDQMISGGLTVHGDVLTGYARDCTDSYDPCPAEVDTKDTLTLPSGRQMRFLPNDDWDNGTFDGTAWYASLEYTEDSCYAMNVRLAASGATVWKVADGLADYRIALGSHLVTIVDDRLSSYDLEADKELWSVHLQDIKASKCQSHLFILDDETILVADEEGLQGFALQDGQQVWTKVRPFPSVAWSSDDYDTNVYWQPLPGGNRLLATIGLGDRAALVEPLK
ncbi:MAG: PQQ-binding-like beta-propeller repeat protein [Propionibacteriaceae bacterium]|jgi:hypothetical protein|nr:PQQ-binding-like beta-propeller repeat protein [Propionibacteriaceae bacterium]